MIGKVPKAGRGFRGLVRYLLHGARRGSDRLHPRVAWTATRNLFVDDPIQSSLLMRMTAAKSVRVRRPVYHLVISWTPAEKPTPEIMLQVADATCRELGLANHQRLYVAHRDTRHPHVHIVVNRIHPETGTAWSASHDYRRIELSLARQAQQLGMIVVPGRHNEGLDRRSPRRPTDGAYQKSRREGRHAPVRMSPDRIAELKPLLVPLFAAARSWIELRNRLAGHGLDIVRKGQGLVLTGADGEMKISALGAGVRLAGLEARLGRWPERTRLRRQDRER